MSKFRIFIGFVILTTTLALAACGTAANATPTVGANQVITEVAQTVQAGFTLTQATMPTSTPTLTPVPTATPTATQATTPTTFIVNISTTLPKLPSNSNSPDRLRFSADITVADGDTFLPSKEFVKTWLIQNIGTTTWTKSYRFAYCSGLPVNIVDKIIPKLMFNLSEDVPPQAYTEISVNVFAPEINGGYKVYFQLLTSSGKQVPDEDGYLCALWVYFLVNDGINPMPTP